MNRARLQSVAGYPAFFFFCFFLFAYCSFPYERVATYITDKVNDSGTGYQIEIGDLSPYWVTGIEVEDVEITKQSTAPELTLPPPAEGKGKGKTKTDPSLKVVEARARIGIFSLLLGNRAISFDAELEAGEAEGYYEESSDGKHLEATLSEVDIGKLGLLDSVVSLPTKGTVEGEFDVTLGKEPTQSNGTVKLQIKGLTIGDGTAKLKLGAMGGLTIDPVEVGTVTMELDVKDGVGTVKKLTNDGPDLELEGSGEVRLADPPARSRVDLTIRLKIKDAYRNKTSRTKTLMSLLDGATVPQVRAAKTPDGALQYRLAGTLSGLRALPSGRSRPSGGARRTTRDIPEEPMGDDFEEE